MTDSIYNAEPLAEAEGGDIRDISGHERTAPYLPSAGLKAAVKVALMLGRPLLLTGEAGTGKTSLAYHLADDFAKESQPLRFDTKSDSSARDLFYTYDALGHFRAIQVPPHEANPMDYIQLNALGLAILRSHDASALQTMERDLLPLLQKSMLKNSKGDTDEKHTSACRSVVLIDEIDKAPRDFPNDVLNEVENLCFSIPELNLQRPIRVTDDPHLRPVLILTSNSERHLPDAFLRRCVYHDIQFPEKTTELWDIINCHLKDISKPRKAHFDEALSFFQLLRKRSDLKKKPATAELISWLRILNHTCTAEHSLAAQKEQVFETLGVLLKSREDLEASKAEWNKQYQGAE